MTYFIIFYPPISLNFYLSDTWTVYYHLIFNCPHHRPSLVKISDLYPKMTYFIIFYPPISLNFYISDIWTVCYHLFFKCPHHGPSLVKISDLYSKMTYFIIFYPLLALIFTFRISGRFTTFCFLIVHIMSHLW